MTLRFEPGQPAQPVFVAYGAAAIPDIRDDAIDEFVNRVCVGGPTAVANVLAQVSEAGRRVLRVYGERCASRAVRERSTERLVAALVAVVIGGLDQNALEAMMPMALIEDAGRRIGAEPGVFFGKAADIVGHPASVNLMVWLTRREEDRTPEAMGFAAAHDKFGFRYKWTT